MHESLANAWVISGSGYLALGAGRLVQSVLSLIASRSGLTPTRFAAAFACSHDGGAESFGGVRYYNRGMPESSSEASSTASGDNSFGSTHWSVVVAAGQDGTAARNALEALCRTYWFPIYAYVRRRVHNSDDAHDLTQAFFARLLEKQTIAAADRSRGRFRAFLLTALKNFLANEHAKATAQKRGAGRTVISLDVDVAERRLRRDEQTQMTPEREFERRWALALLDRVISRLEAEQVTAGRQREFEVLGPFLTGQNAETTQADAAEELEISEEAVRAGVYRLRKRYRVLLRDEIARTINSAGDVDDELQRLFEALEM